MLRRGLGVSGRVVDERGEPVAGAEVSLLDDPRFGLAEPAATAEDGSFRITGLSPGIWRPQVTKEGLIQADPHARVEVTEPISGLDVRMVRGAVITGRVSGLEPSEIPRVRMTAAPLPPPGPWLNGHLDHQAGYRIDGVGPGAWRVTATVPDGGSAGHERSAAGVVDLAAGEREARLDLDLSGRFVLSGRVTLGDEPVAGAMVWVNSLEPSRVAHTRTGTDGGFRVARLASGHHEITVDSFDPAFRHVLEVDLDGDHEVRIELAESAVAGRVVDAESGAALGGATVRLVPEGRGGGSREGARSADADGGFRLPRVAPGDYLLQVDRDGYAGWHRELTVGPEGIDGLEVALAPAGEVVIEVTSTTGAPLRQVTVAVLHPGAADPQRDAAPHPVAAVAGGGTFVPDEHDRIRVGELPTGRGRALVAAPWMAVSEVEITVPGPPVRVLLAPQATIEVTVHSLDGRSRARLLAADGRPLLLPDSGFGHTWVLSGRARLDNVPAGSWTLEVAADDGREWSRQVTAVAGAMVEVVFE